MGVISARSTFPCGRPNLLCRYIFHGHIPIWKWLQMWDWRSNVRLTFKCEIDVQMWDWRSNVRLTFKCEIDVQMWEWPSNVRLTFKCEIDVQMWDWHSNLRLTFKFESDVTFKFESDVQIGIWPWKMYLQSRFGHPQGKDTFGTDHDGFSHRLNSKYLYMAHGSYYIRTPSNLLFIFTPNTVFCPLATSHLPQHALQQFDLLIRVITKTIKGNINHRWTNRALGLCWFAIQRLWFARKRNYSIYTQEEQQLTCKRIL